MKNMACKRVGNVVIVVHNKEPPDNESWSGYLDTVLATGRANGNDLTNVKQLVVTEGGGPNASQRKAVDAASNQMNGKKSPAAVVTGSPLVRGIVTVFNWFNLNLRVFAPEEFDKALQFLRIPSTEVPKILNEVRLLQAEVGSPPLGGIRGR